METKKAKDYAKELSKSLFYAARSVASDLAPDLAAAAEPTATYVREAASDLRRSGVGNMLRGQFSKLAETEEIGLLRKAMQNAKRDLKKGSLYDPDRADAAAMASLGMDDFGGDGDFGFGDEMDEMLGLDGDDEGGGGDDGEGASAPSSGGSVARMALGRTISSDPGTQARLSALGVMIGEGQARLGDAAFRSLGVLEKQQAFNVTHVAEHHKVSAQYYKGSLELLQKMESHLDVLAAPRRAMMKNGMLGSGGSDRPGFLTRVVEEFLGYGMMDMFKMMLKGFADDPIGTITKSFVTGMIPPKFRKSLEGFNTAFRNLGPLVQERMAQEAGKTSNPVIQVLLRALGATPQKISVRPNLGAYEKGKVDFDGVTRKAIIEVIPTLLGKIHARLGRLPGADGPDELLYDYRKGTFTTRARARAQGRAEANQEAAGGLYDLQKAGGWNTPKAQQAKLDSALAGLVRQGGSLTPERLEKALKGIKGLDPALARAVIGRYSAMSSVQKLEMYESMNSRRDSLLRSQRDGLDPYMASLSDEELDPSNRRAARGRRSTYQGGKAKVSGVAESSVVGKKFRRSTADSKKKKSPFDTFWRREEQEEWSDDRSSAGAKLMRAWEAPFRFLETKMTAFTNGVADLFFGDGKKQKGVLTGIIIKPLNWLFGEYGADGKIVKKGVAERLYDGFKSKFVDPLQHTLKPFIEEMKLQVKKLGGWAKTAIRDVYNGVDTFFEKAFGFKLLTSIKGGAQRAWKAISGPLMTMLGPVIAASEKLREKHRKMGMEYAASRAHAAPTADAASAVGGEGDPAKSTAHSSATSAFYLRKLVEASGADEKKKGAADPTPEAEKKKKTSFRRSVAPTVAQEAAKHAAAEERHAGKENAAPRRAAPFSPSILAHGSEGLMAAELARISMNTGQLYGVRRELKAIRLMLRGHLAGKTKEKAGGMFAGLLGKLGLGGKGEYDPERKGLTERLFGPLGAWLVGGLSSAMSAPWKMAKSLGRGAAWTADRAGRAAAWTVESTVNVLRAGINAVSWGFDHFGKHVVDLTAWMGKQIVSATSFLVKGLWQLTLGAGSAFGRLGGSLFRGAAAVGDVTMKGLAAVTPGLGSGLGSLLKGLGEGGGWLLGKLGKGAGSILGGAGSAIGGGLRAIGGAGALIGGSALSLTNWLLGIGGGKNGRGGGGKAGGWDSNHEFRAPRDAQRVFVVGGTLNRLERLGPSPAKAAVASVATRAKDTAMKAWNWTTGKVMDAATAVKERISAAKEKKKTEARETERTSLSKKMVEHLHFIRGGLGSVLSSLLGPAITAAMGLASPVAGAASGLMAGGAGAWLGAKWASAKAGAASLWGRAGAAATRMAPRTAGAARMGAGLLSKAALPLTALLGLYGGVTGAADEVFAPMGERDKGLSGRIGRQGRIHGSFYGGVIDTLTMGLPKAVFGKSVKEMFSNIGDGVGRAVGDFMASSAKKAGGALQWATEGIKQGVAWWWEKMTGFYGGMFTNAKDFLTKTVAQPIMKVFAGIGDAIVSMIPIGGVKDAWNGLKASMLIDDGPLGGTAATPYNLGASSFRAPGQAAFGPLAPAQGGGSAGAGGSGSGGTGGGGFFSRIGGAISGAASSAYNAVYNIGFGGGGVQGDPSAGRRVGGRRNSHIPYGTDLAGSSLRRRDVSRPAPHNFNPVSFQGMQISPMIEGPLRSMVDAAAKDKVNIRVTSGYRTLATQRAIYASARPGMAARPGYSVHEHGYAVDLNTRDPRVLNWLTRNARRFGFLNPQMFTSSDEDWHWELAAGAQEGRYNPSGGGGASNGSIDDGPLGGTAASPYGLLGRAFRAPGQSAPGPLAPASLASGMPGPMTGSLGAMGGGGGGSSSSGGSGSGLMVGGGASPAPSGGSASVRQWWPLIQRASARHGVPAALIAGIIQTESGGNPNARSPVGAGGLMQLMPGTAAGLGLRGNDRFNPEKNVMAGTQYISQMLRAFGNNPQDALTAYNWGPGNMGSYIKRGRQGRVPAEARAYAAKVLAAARAFGGTGMGPAAPSQGPAPVPVLQAPAAPQAPPRASFAPSAGPMSMAPAAPSWAPAAPAAPARSQESAGWGVELLDVAKKILTQVTITAKAAAEGQERSAARAAQAPPAPPPARGSGPKAQGSFEARAARELSRGSTTAYTKAGSV